MVILKVKLKKKNMKKLTHFCLILGLNIIFNQLIAQNGMPKWVFPNANSQSNSAAQVFDLNTSSLSTLPLGPNSRDYQGQKPNWAFTNHTDNNGNVDFFIIDNTK